MIMWRLTLTKRLITIITIIMTVTRGTLTAYTPVKAIEPPMQLFKKLPGSES